MLNLKKTAAAVLAFGSSALFADTMGSGCMPGSVTVPCEHSAWEFAIQILYLKPSYSSVRYVGNLVNSTGTMETYNRQRYNWGWGFKLEAAYDFNSGNNLDINWYHFNRNATQTVSGAIVLANSTINFVNNTLTGQPKWDAVNLEFGQIANFGDTNRIRFHGGLAFARVQNTGNLSGIATTDNIPPVTGSYSVGTTLNYSGFGPRLGMDMSYMWENGFTVYANGATALLVGTSSFNRTAISPVAHAATAAVGLIPTNLSASSTQIVPELEAKVGIAYIYAMAQGDLSLDLGWMWFNYFHALQTGIYTGLDGAGTTFSTSSDFGVQGPYLGLKWVGNVA